MAQPKFQGKYRIESTRLPDRDYGENGWYFVTICTKDCIFHLGNGVVYGQVQLTPIGEITFLKGDISRTDIKPGDELEYTVYFLSSGSKPITNARICDMIPANTTYVPGSIQMFINGTTTNLTDATGDAGEFFAPGNTPTVPCPTDNGKGAVVVNVAESPAQLLNAASPGTPSDSYGCIRFRVKVD